MLEGLPPNNAAHMMRLVCDEARARAIADLVVESFEPAETAAAAFEIDAPQASGGKAWTVEVYFGFAPDEELLRELVAAAAGEEAAAALEFGRTPERDWVANALAGLSPVRAGRFLVHGAHDRARVKSQRRRHRDRGGAGLRHRPSWHDARLPAASGARAAPPPPPTRPRRRLRHRRAGDRRRQGAAHPRGARRHRSRRGRGRQRKCAAQRRRRLLRPLVSRGVEARSCAPAALTISSSPIFWPSRCAASRPRWPP